jgi:hypothetical protein
MDDNKQLMGVLFFGIPMLMYALQGALVYFAAGRYGMTLCVSAYALANVGLILDLFGI